MPPLKNYQCPRCGHTECEVGQDYAMNWPGTRYTTVTCARCRCTEFFAAKPDELPALFSLMKEAPRPDVR
jgi:predicted nucleic-acid-binding Zn-ribbon protein